MSIFSWNKSYEIGIEKIDEQHKNLVEIISHLFESMKVGLGYKEINPTIEQLRDYTIYHFTEEEKYMKEINYPEISEHIESHQYFIEIVQDFAKRQLEGEIALSLKLLDFLKNWLLNHILVTDKKIAIFVEEQNLLTKQ